MRASRRNAIFTVVCLLVRACPAPATEGQPAAKAIPPLELRSLNVNGQPVSIAAKKRLRLGATPRNVSFGFGAATNAARAPLRMRYKLDGVDENWREVSGDMTIAVRFTDANLDQVSEKTFRMVGETEGWTGELATSVFVHRQERMIVPAGTKSLWVAISSAGPPNTVGIYALTNLVPRRLPASKNDAPA